MLQRFLDYIHKQHLLPAGQKVLLAVSGGRDSVTLAHLIHRAGIPFAVAHCNFHLRPDECLRDQQFVRSFAEDYGASFHTVDFDTCSYAATHGQSIEEAARELRYEWFASLCRDYGYVAVATAHHQDDSIETFFLNLFRGTGIAGLHGIRPNSQFTIHNSQLTIVRPLLCFSRAEIDRYVVENGLSFVEDSSNALLDARRNQIRLRLMPLLRELYPSVDDTMAGNIERLRDAEILYCAYIDELRLRLLKPYRSLLSWLPFEILSLDLNDFSILNSQFSILFEFLRPYGFNASQVSDIAQSFSRATAQPPSGKLFFSPTHVAELHRGALLIAPDLSPVVPQLTIHNPTLSIHPFQNFSQRLSLNTQRSTYLDASLVRPPLTLRPWSRGDRFHPFGMDGSRLVSDFLKDLHLSRIERRHVHLLVDADGRIVWVVGLRADNRFRLTGTTTDTLTVSLA